MKHHFSLIFTIAALLLSQWATAQNEHANQLKVKQQTPKNQKAMLNKAKAEEKEQAQRVAEYAKASKVPLQVKDKEGHTKRLAYIDAFNQPQYVGDDNENAAKTISVDKVRTGGSLGYNLDGEGMTIHVWEAGGVALATHNEFNDANGSRIIVGDGTNTVSGHATHVTGTLIAEGEYAPARGMAYKATAKAFSQADEFSEMATETGNGIIISNHSYGFLRGWNGNTWYGNPSVSTQEDFYFGFYDGTAQNWDYISYLTPAYLIVKSAGNDRNDTGDGSYPDDGPYDTIGVRGTAKNILTVGAVDDIAAGYTQPTDVVMSSFSSWGPTDDGRIKPDVVANGVNLISAWNTSNNDYYQDSGTSMATPSAAGALLLVQEHFNDAVGGPMYAEALKALAIHTANEAGTTAGPDYSFGWGLLNIEQTIIKLDQSLTGDPMAMQVPTLVQGTPNTFKALVTGNEPVKATMVWSDVWGQPVGDADVSTIADYLDNPKKMLVNDLDLTLTDDTNTYYPWSLDKDNPANAATNTTKNDTDNVEKVEAGSLTAGTVVEVMVTNDGTIIGVDNAGNLLGNYQRYALITSGLTSNDAFANAVEITTEGYSSPQAFYNTKIGTADGNSYSCNSTTPKNNVWFKFTATAATQSLFVLADNNHGDLQNPVLSLWQSDGTTQIGCQEGTTLNAAYLHVDNLTVRETYYVAVDNASSAGAGSFTLFADASALQTLDSTVTPEPGTFRYNANEDKFQGWNGTQWVNFN